MDSVRVKNLGLHVLAKPIGPICNLDCAYCYYLSKEKLYPQGEQWRMETPILEKYIRDYIATQPAQTKEIEFGWQGGEPTLLGVEFFKQVVELQVKHTPPGKRCHNSIQTNGVLLDERWCSFLKAHDFLVGLSLDGPADLHDRYRVDKQRRPTSERVLRGLRLLQRFGVEHNALVVVNRHNGDHPQRVYRFLKESGVRFLQFIPIVERADGDKDSVSGRSVRPEQWGRFLIEVFQQWSRQDVGRVFVQLFDQALAAWMGLEPSLCIFQRECGRALALEHNGDLYSCDHFVDPDHLLGNIGEISIAELAQSTTQLAFGNEKLTRLPRYCRECPVRFVCNGGCPKNRFVKTGDGEQGLNYLCSGYRMFFRHIDDAMKMMAAAVRSGRPAAAVMPQLQVQSATKPGRTQAAPHQVRRNDPCPCGSGRKYKNCCLRR